MTLFEGKGHTGASHPESSMRSAHWLVIPFLAGSLLSAQALSRSSIREATTAVAAVLDDWHLAAAQSDEERFFSRMAPEAVFLGMDEKERWTKDAFRKWAHEGFEGHMTWHFKASQRNIALSEDGGVAWFDEVIDMSGNGTARGSGVLVKTGTSWMIAQYNLSLPIPRGSFTEVRQIIEAQKIVAESAKHDKARPERPEK
jgi:ketosteroid isomerase-like protein